MTLSFHCRECRVNPWSGNRDPTFYAAQLKEKKKDQKQEKIYLQCVHACSVMWLFVTPQIVAYQAPLSMGFSRPEYWSGLPFPSPGDLLNPGTKPLSLASPALYSTVGVSGKEFTCQNRRHGFDPWVRKIPWRREWQPTPVFWPGEFHVQRSLAGYSPWGHTRVGYNWETFSFTSLSRID